MSVRRDYKPAPSSRKRRQTRGLGLVVITLVAIGTFAGVLAYLARPLAPVSTGTAPPPDVRQARAIPPAPKPKYDFYQELPRRQVLIPEEELQRRAPRVRPDPPTKPQTGAAARTGFMVQAGSFRSPADADRMKASLALLGMVARVETSRTEGITWHRVRIGPVGDAATAQYLRQRLKEQGIDSIAIRMD